MLSRVARKKLREVVVRYISYNISTAFDTDDSLAELMAEGLVRPVLSTIGIYERYLPTPLGLAMINCRPVSLEHPLLDEDV